MSAQGTNLLTLQLFERVRAALVDASDRLAAERAVRAVLSDPVFTAFFQADEVLTVVWLELWPSELARQRDLTS